MSATRAVLPFAIAMLAMLATTAEAQAPRYRAPAGEVHVAMINPYRMYWLRGGDTLGSHVAEASLERQRWTTTGSGLSVVIEQKLLDVRRRVRSDTFAIEPDGRVTTINAKPPGLNSRVDLVLRLPHVPLRVGTAWADTMHNASEGPGGQHRYDVRRSYEAKRELDTLGRHVLLVQASGQVDYRDGWWADSARGVAAWIDVTGPLTEQFYFDVRAGQLVARSWKMDLRGKGAVPIRGGTLDTLPAGLLSEERQWIIDASIAEVAARELPRGDTSITTSGTGGQILLHSVKRTADTIETGFGRNDGMVGTARAEFSGGVPTRYTARWTSDFEKATEQRVVRDSAVLRVSGTGADTTVAIPNSAWGIADYSMQELLVPVILALPADGIAHPFAIYRPYPRHWDNGTIVVRAIPDGRIAMLKMGDDKKPQAMLITSVGDYLYGENSDPMGAERAPAPGSARRAQLEALLKRMQERKGTTPSPSA